MAVTFIGADNDPTSGDLQSSSKSVDKPAGAQIGVFYLTFWTGTDPGTITPPSGAVQRDSTDNGSERTVSYLKYVDGDTTGTTYTFNFANSSWSALTALFFAGVDAGLTLASVPYNTANGSGTNYATTTVTTVSGAALAWSGNVQDYGSTSADQHAPPTNFTETADTFGAGAAYRISPGTGSQSASGATNQASVASIAALVALAPTATAGPSGTFNVADVASVGFIGARDSAAAFDVPDVATVQWTATRESAGASAVDDAATVEWIGARDSTATFDVDDTATVQWTGSITATASFAIDDVVTVAWTGVGEQGVLAAIIVGAVTGPSRRVETVTGPALRREITGPTVRRELAGPQLESVGVDGPSRHVDDLDGPGLSRLVTGPDTARVLTGAGV